MHPPARNPVCAHARTFFLFGGGRPFEVLVCFKPCLPYAHVKRPGR
jgi:hypothetical protein